MAFVLIWQLDDEVVRRLEQRAAGNNRSLECEVRHILEQAAGESMEEKRRAFRELSKRLYEQQTGDRPQTSSHILIREDRDSGHGSLKRSAVDILDEAPGQRLFKSAEDVESYLKDERASWDQ